jgi:hypothetical protein
MEQIEKVYTIIGSVGSPIDPNTPYGKSAAEQLSKFAYQQLRQNQPNFAVKYNLVDKQQPVHQMNFIGLAKGNTSDTMAAATLDFLSSQGYGVLDIKTGINLFLHAIDGTNPVTGQVTQFYIAVYFVVKGAANAPAVTGVKENKKGRFKKFINVLRGIAVILLCGTYIVFNLLIIDELNMLSDVNGRLAGFAFVAVLGNVLSIAGIVILLLMILLLKRSNGIFIALTGSAISLIFALLSERFTVTFIEGQIRYAQPFNTHYFIEFMLIEFLPGLLLLLLQLKSIMKSKKKPKKEELRF